MFRHSILVALLLLSFHAAAAGVRALAAYKDFLTLRKTLTAASTS